MNVYNLSSNIKLITKYKKHEFELGILFYGNEAEKNSDFTENEIQIILKIGRNSYLDKSRFVCGLQRTSVINYSFFSCAMME